MSFRVASAALICGLSLTLAACGGEDSTTKAGSAKPGGAAPTSAAAPAAAGGASDKELCQSAKKAGDEMRTALIAALKSAGGDPSGAAFKKLLTDAEQKLTALSSTGGDGKVTAAMKQIATEAGKAAADADPATAAGSGAFEKAGADLTAACKAVGVDVNF